MIVITVYRVCHKARDNSGPNTAYTREYVAMREERTKKHNLMKQILNDVQELIQEYKKKGFHPIVIIDANGDYRI